MTRYFVVAYKRSLGRLLQIAEFEQDAGAFARRMELDLQYRSDPDVEVALLAAESLGELKKTHSRYFKSFAEIAKAATG
jgi:hypothetical protein